MLGAAVLPRTIYSLSVGKLTVLHQTGKMRLAMQDRITASAPQCKSTSASLCRLVSQVACLALLRTLLALTAD